MVLGEHERARAHRPDVVGEADRGHARLRVELLGLPGHRRHERHRHPVIPLRIAALDAHAERVLVGRRGTGERELAEIEERPVEAGRIEAGAQPRVLALDHVAVFLQPEHVFREDAVDRRRDAGRGVALERVDEVLGHQFARALDGEIERRRARSELARLQVVVQEVAVGVLGERRMRLPEDAVLDVDVVDALGDLLARRVVGQLLAILVEEARLRDLLCRFADQRERSLQVVVAVGLLVDLVRERGVVGPVRRDRIHVAGRPLLHRAEDRVLAGGAAFPGAVVTTGQGHQQRARDQPGSAAPTTKTTAHADLQNSGREPGLGVHPAGSPTKQNRLRQPRVVPGAARGVTANFKGAAPGHP